MLRAPLPERQPRRQLLVSRCVDLSFRVLLLVFLGRPSPAHLVIWGARGRPDWPEEPAEPALISARNTSKTRKRTTPYANAPMLAVGLGARPWLNPPFCRSVLTK